MDRWVCLYPSPDPVIGVHYAIVTVFFAGLPLALFGIWLARVLLRRTGAPIPLPDALHPLARFALVLLALNLCVLAPAAGSIAAALLLECQSPFSLFATLFVAATSTAATYGAMAWRDILRDTAQTRLLSLALAKPFECN